MMFGFFLIPLVILAAIAYAFGWRPEITQNKSTLPDQNPLETLKSRYARGEITREEYEQARKTLEG